MRFTIPVTDAGCTARAPAIALVEAASPRSESPKMAFR